MATPAYIFFGFTEASDTNSISCPGADINLFGTLQTMPFLSLFPTYYVEYDVSGGSFNEGWLFGYVRNASQDVGNAIITLSGPTQDLFRIIAVNTSTAGDQKAQYYNGSTWVDIGTLSTTLNSNGGYPKRIDIYWKIADSGGAFTVYVEGAEAASVTGIDTLLTADTTINTVHFSNPDASSTIDYGPLVVDGVDTRDLEWSESLPTADGTYTEWSFGETYVDTHLWVEADVTTATVGDADGERLTFSIPGIAADFTGYSVEWVGIGVQVKAQADPALYAKPYVRKSSTNYTPSGGGSFQPRAAYDDVHVFPIANDPSTGSPWADQVAVEACELGVILSSTA